MRFFVGVTDWDWYSLHASASFVDEINIVSGESYDTASELGQRLLQEVKERLLPVRERVANPGAALTAATADRFGPSQLVYPRLGQGLFRILVTGAYQRSCAITGEKTLPVLEAAHIRPYACAGLREFSNGVLLRSNLHTLFDTHFPAQPKIAKPAVSTYCRSVNLLGV